MQELFNFVIWCVTCISILLALFVVLKYRYWTDYLRYFSFWLINGAVMEGFSKFLAEKGIPNLFLFHVHAVTEFCILVLFFDALMKNTRFSVVKYVLFPGIFAIVLNSMFLQNLTSFNSNSLTAISLGVILICIIYFVRLSDSTMSMDKKMFRLIIVGTVFILHGTNLLPLLFSNFLLTMDSANQMIVWIIRACVILTVKLILLFTLLSYVNQPELKNP